MQNSPTRLPAQETVYPNLPPPNCLPQPTCPDFPYSSNPLAPTPSTPSSFPLPNQLPCPLKSSNMVLPQPTTNPQPPPSPSAR